MASKNLGAVIQRAISDGAFRRQLQSDPATALRGFNLSPDEIAAIRSGDSGKLMSLGVDQRMSKAFTVGANFLGGAMRSTTSDLTPGGAANTLVGDQTSGAREGIVGDPTSNAENAHSTGTLSGTRAIHEDAPFEGNAHGVVDPTISGTRAIHEDAPADLRSAASTGDLSGTRAVNDVAPFGTPGTSAIEDPNAPEFARDATISDNIAAANAGRGGSLTGDMASAANDPYSGTYTGVSPDFEGSLASRMADASLADATRAIHEDAPFEGNANAAAASGSELVGGDAHLDPGIDAGQGVVSEGPTGDTGDEHSWG
jgi:hypothetical protein